MATIILYKLTKELTLLNINLTSTISTQKVGMYGIIKPFTTNLTCSMLTLFALS